MSKSLAISYSMKKKKKKENTVKGDIKGVHTGYPQEYKKGKSLAGELVRDAKESGKEKWAQKNELAKILHEDKLEELKSDKGDRKNLAEGGEVNDGGDPAWVCSKCGDHGQTFSGHQDSSNALDMIESILSKRRMASGGYVKPPPPPPIVSKEEADKFKKGAGFSHGGQIANDTDFTADTLPNEFDDLVLRDDEEMEGYSDESSGDDDLVDKALKRRKKKA